MPRGSNPTYHVTIRNWEKHQRTYRPSERKRSRREWVAFDTRLLHDRDYRALTVEQKLLWLSLLLWAGLHGPEFSIDASLARKTFDFRRGWRHIEDFRALKNQGFIDLDVSNLPEKPEKTDKTSKNDSIEDALSTHCGRIEYALSTNCERIEDNDPNKNQQVPDLNVINKTGHNRTEEKKKNIQKKKDSTRVAVRHDQRFDEFWSGYPKKVGKKDARKAWESNRLDKLADDIIADIAEKSARDRKWLEGFIPNPATYLRGERWEDEIEEVRQAPRKLTSYEEGQRELIEWAREQGVIDDDSDIFGQKVTKLFKD